MDISPPPTSATTIRNCWKTAAWRCCRRCSGMFGQRVKFAGPRDHAEGVRRQRAGALDAGSARQRQRAGDRRRRQPAARAGRRPAGAAGAGQWLGGHHRRRLRARHRRNQRLRGRRARARRPIRKRAAKTGAGERNVRVVDLPACRSRRATGSMPTPTASSSRNRSSSEPSCQLRSCTRRAVRIRLFLPDLNAHIFARRHHGERVFFIGGRLVPHCETLHKFAQSISSILRNFVPHHEK